MTSPTSPAPAGAPAGGATVVSEGLAGVVIGPSAVCRVSPEKHGLLYRGYRCSELAAHCSFEAVAWLLMHGELPAKREAAAFAKAIAQAARPTSALKKLLDRLPPNSNVMAVLQAGLAATGVLNGRDTALTPAQIHELYPAFLGETEAILAWWACRVAGRKFARSKQKSMAGRLLEYLTGQPADAARIDAMHASLILYAEHGLNASTFAARVIASTLAGPYAALSGAIGALSGPLHGGANEAVLDLLNRFADTPAAVAGVEAMLANKEKVMGFGHRVYRAGDGRSDVIQGIAQKLAAATGKQALYDKAAAVEKLVVGKKNIHPNLDFYSAVAYDCLGIEKRYFTPIFVVARMSGWCANLAEQWQHNRLIRPLSQYTGPAERSLPARFKRD